MSQAMQRPEVLGKPASSLIRLTCLLMSTRCLPPASGENKGAVGVGVI